MEDWANLRNVTHSTASYVTLALRLLQEVLTSIYGKPSIASLLTSDLSIPIFLNYANKLNEAIDRHHWKRQTTAVVLCALRKVLNKAGVHKAFVRATRMRRLPCTSSVMPKKWRSLSFAAQSRIESWIALVKKHSNNQSNMTVYNMLYFFMTILREFDLDIEHWPLDAQTRIEQRCRDENVICKMAGVGKNASTHLHWFQFFLTHIIGSTCVFSKELVRQIGRRVVKEEDDIDRHRMSKEELEQVYDVAMKKELNELFFLTLLTTGMRIGAFVKMKCVHVAELKDGKWHARTEGKTLEKGSKWFTFKIHPRVRELLGGWFNKDRELLESEYVFPGSENGHTTTQMFRRRFTQICKEAGLAERRLHPHALRHSYSYMLLQLGNPAEVVAKLINHRNVMTTQKYYLKETAAEVSERANVPWVMKPPTNKCPVPDFLLSKCITHEAQINEAQKLRSSLMQLLSSVT